MLCWKPLDDSFLHEVQYIDSSFVNSSSPVSLLADEPVEFEAKCEINTDLLNKMIGGLALSSSKDATGYTFTAQIPYQVQVRRHKKKRINKKWAKRYGYVTMFKTIRLTDVHFTPGSNEFLCNVEGLYET